MHILSHTKVNDLSKGLIQNFASLTLVKSYIYVFCIMSNCTNMGGDLTIYPLVCDRTACTRYPFAPPTPSPIKVIYIFLSSVMVFNILICMFKPKETIMKYVKIMLIAQLWKN